MKIEMKDFAHLNSQFLCLVAQLFAAFGILTFYDQHFCGCSGIRG